MFDILNQWRDLIEAALEERSTQAFPADEQLSPVAKYVLLGGGKRLRGLLVLALAHDCGAEIDRESPYLDVAVALEALHAASLVHDDLPALDNDAMRRGKPSCHVAFGESTAILAGDAIVGLAFFALGEAMLGDRERSVSLCALADAWTRLCRGQILDLMTAGKGVSREVMALKTGALFAAAAVAGVSAVATASELRAWSEWGTALGVLFQKIDDVLDGEGAVADLGAVRSEIDSLILELREWCKCTEQAPPLMAEKVMHLFIPAHVRPALSSNG